MPLRRGDFQCAVCALIFASDDAFSTHRTGPHDHRRRCRTEAELFALTRKDGSPRFERDSFGRLRLASRTLALQIAAN
jgi:hypothetical protein